jgi:hypothetical protein
MKEMIDQDNTSNCLNESNPFNENPMLIGQTKLDWSGQFIIIANQKARPRVGTMIAVNNK